MGLVALAVAFALGHPSTVLLTAGALPAIAVATILFHRAVEPPSHELARWLGTATAARLAPA